MSQAVEEFFNVLSTLRGLFAVKRDGEIRTKKKYRMDNGKVCCLCPIEAAARAKTGAAKCVDDAARQLRLRASSVEALISAADALYETPTECRYRKEMLDALGLTEKKQ